MATVEVAHRIEGDPSLPDDAPTVVLSNSLGSTMAMWDAQVAALSRVARVVRYDTRGHGRSPVPPGPYSIDDLADDVIALLDRLEKGVTRRMPVAPATRDESLQESLASLRRLAMTR